jgi:predicted translin family RNA/ssDNA-binding protein
MRSVVEARFQLDRARERLHKLNQKLRNADSDSYERQREKALGEYIEAMGEARIARTRLLKQLREHVA